MRDTTNTAMTQRFFAPENLGGFGHVSSKACVLAQKN
jgi:hypothetical protein